MKLLIILFLFIPTIVFGHAHEKPFIATISPIPLTIKAKIKQYTWHPGCPTPLKDLRYLQMSYWGFDNQTHQGAMIVNKMLAKEVTEIFQSLYEHHFPIQQMELMDKFKGNDAASMFANNTSAFNCRAVTGQPGLFSQHSYGRAIDINPKMNPYVNGKEVSPANGATYQDRLKAFPGKITKTSLIYLLFMQKGWDWGGNWYDVQDYQHFEKRAHGEKRNPYGYGNKPSPLSNPSKL